MLVCSLSYFGTQNSKGKYCKFNKIEITWISNMFGICWRLLRIISFSGNNFAETVLFLCSTSDMTPSLFFDFFCCHSPFLFSGWSIHSHLDFSKKKSQSLFGHNVCSKLSNYCISANSFCGAILFWIWPYVLWLLVIVHKSVETFLCNLSWTQRQNKGPDYLGHRMYQKKHKKSCTSKNNRSQKNPHYKITFFGS